MPAKHGRPGLWPGLMLVGLGVGLLARELGYLPPSVRVVDFWPLLVLVFGVAGLLHARGFLSALFALSFAGIGCLLLAGNLGFIAFPAARLWPGLLILFGLASLLGARRQRGLSRQQRALSDERGGAAATPAECLPLTSGEDRLIRQLAFSGSQIKVESEAWRGGEVGVTVGGIELDLRNAKLHPDGALLEVRVLMGGIEIRVPDTWQVQCDVTPFFGGADDTTRSTQGTPSAPRLRIVGTVTLGGVSIGN